MATEEYREGFMSFSGSRRMRVRIRRPDQAVGDSKSNPGADDDRSASFVPQGEAPSETRAATQERRPRPAVARRGPGRRLSCNAEAQGLRARSPINLMDWLRGVVILAIVAFALWVDWMVAKAVVGYLSSWF